MSLVIPTAAETRQLAPAPRRAASARTGATMYARGEADQHRERMMALVGPIANLPRPTGYLLLVAQFVPPETTKEGIIRPEISKREDRWQGNVGLVLALGPECYHPDSHRKFLEPWCKPGDWVIFAVTNESGRRFRWAGVADCFLLIDDHIMAVVDDPVDIA